MSMVDDFYAYVTLRRPSVEDAYDLLMSGLLGDIPAGDRAFLMRSLKAGKKIRGCLSCLTCEALGGPFESAVSRAVAVEMIQAATLVHDDLVDQDTVRGDRPALWTVEGPRRAVLIGDVIFASAIKMMSDASADDGRAVAEAIAHISMGALQEPLGPAELAKKIEGNGPLGTMYETIIHLKTAMLFGVACTLGAIAAGRQGTAAETCRRYGLLIGEAYQIADDVKEVRRHVSDRSIDPGRMAALAPALLRFVPPVRPFILDVLRGDRSDIDDGELRHFEAAAALMEDEIRRRQHSAAQIGCDLPRNGYSAAALRAPMDIIAMFNESG